MRERCIIFYIVYTHAFLVRNRQSVDYVAGWLWWRRWDLYCLLAQNMIGQVYWPYKFHIWCIGLMILSVHIFHIYPNILFFQLEYRRFSTFHWIERRWNHRCVRCIKHTFILWIKTAIFFMLVFYYSLLFRLREIWMWQMYIWYYLPLLIEPPSHVLYVWRCEWVSYLHYS